MIARYCFLMAIALGLPILSCSSEQIESEPQSSFVDSATPKSALPANTQIGTDWVLSFSDEFNDSRIDFNKWVVKDESRGKRDNLGIAEWFFKPQNVAEEDGNLVLKVSKVGTDQMYCSSVYSNGKYYMQYGAMLKQESNWQT